MSVVNPKKGDEKIITTSKKAANDEPHLNYMGGVSFDITPLLRLKVMAASCFFGEPKYYERSTNDKRPVRSTARHSALSDAQVKELAEKLIAIDSYEYRGLSPVDSMEKAIDAALDYDAEGTLKLAVELRQQDHIRVTPQIIMVRAANHKALKGTGLIRQYNGQVMQRADEPATQMAYQLARFGKPIPNSLKRSWADKLENLNDYALAKYRLESNTVKTVDVVNVARPKATASVDALVKGELKLGDDNTKTWESIRSAGGTWEEAVAVMGHMALLRNIRNLLDNNVDTALWLDKFVEGAKTGQQLPFRYYSAYRMVEGKAPGKVLDAIETALMESLTNLPSLPGKSLVLTDNSGSARTTTTSSMGTMAVNTIGNLMGVLTAMVSDEGTVGAFGDRLSTLEIRKKASVFDQLKQIETLGNGVGLGTEHGIWLAFDDLIKNRKHVDNIFVYSDMQAGHGGLYGTGGYDEFVWGRKGGWSGERYIDVPALVRRYREVVNPDVNVFLVQTAGYADTLMPENYYRTAIIGGWSDQIIRYAATMARIWNDMEKGA